MKEKDIQIFLVKWLQKAYPGLLFHASNNEATYKRADLRAMGSMRGFADLMFWNMKNCPLAFVELKLKKGRQSDAQKEFEEVCGAPYHLIKTDDPEEALAILKGYIDAWTK